MTNKFREHFSEIVLRELIIITTHFYTTIIADITNRFKRKSDHFVSYEIENYKFLETISFNLDMRKIYTDNRKKSHIVLNCMIDDYNSIYSTEDDRDNGISHVSNLLHVDAKHYKAVENEPDVFKIEKIIVL